MKKAARHLLKTYIWILPTLLFVGACVAILLGVLRYSHLSKEYTETESELSQKIKEQEEKIAYLEDYIDQMTSLNMDLEDELHAEQNKNSKFEEQIGELASTVGTLDKLSKTDEELLQKYSKVYFLNEHYVPEDLSEIQDEYAYDESRTFKLHSKVMPYFEDMADAAKEDGVDLWVASAYRSFENQSELKAHYQITYGSGANTFSADQGYSEHQLGTTVDFTTSGIGGGLSGFGETEAFQWLTENAHKYGFILSYPEDNQYYVYEPWHWRFVGVDLATDLHEDEMYFYDMGQREINTYLISIFD